MQCIGQYPNLNPTEMLSVDLKRTQWKQMKANLNEVTQQCKELWVYNSSTAMWETHKWLLQIISAKGGSALQSIQS